MFAVRVVDVHAAAEKVEVMSGGIGKRVANRFAFHRDLANDVKIGKAEDHGAFIAAVGDVEACAVAIESHRYEFFRRGDLGGVEDDFLFYRSVFWIDGDDRLRLREPDVHGAVATDRDCARIAAESPAANDFLIARGDGRELIGNVCGKRSGGSEQHESCGGELTPRLCRRSFR